jgi:hypothetical protein
MILTWTKSLAKGQSPFDWRIKSWVCTTLCLICSGVTNTSVWMEPLSSSSRENFVNTHRNTVSLFEAIFHNETFECSDHKYFVKKIWFNCNRLCFLVFLLQTHLRIHSYISENKKNLIHTSAKIKNSNTDKSNKINLHDKKREELISAPAILAHFMAGARSTI